MLCLVDIINICLEQSVECWTTNNELLYEHITFQNAGTDSDDSESADENNQSAANLPRQSQEPVKKRAKLANSRLKARTAKP